MHGEPVIGDRGYFDHILWVEALGQNDIAGELSQIIISLVDNTSLLHCISTPYNLGAASGTAPDDLSLEINCPTLPSRISVADTRRPLLADLG
jgi:hypothetical protein